MTCLVYSLVWMIRPNRVSGVHRGGGRQQTDRVLDLRRDLPSSGGKSSFI